MCVCVCVCVCVFVHFLSGIFFVRDGHIQHLYILDL